MKKQVNKVWNSTSTRQLAELLTAIDEVDKMRNFLRDVMTEKEIIEIGRRLTAAQLLQDKVKYSDIIKQTKLSSRTVARISDWMQNGCGGYSLALRQIKGNTHKPPVHAG